MGNRAEPHLYHSDISIEMHTKCSGGCNYNLWLEHFLQISLKRKVNNLLSINMLCSCLVTKSRPTLLWPLARLLCPWDFPGKNTGMVCYFSSQGIFLTQGSNLSLLHFGRFFFTTEPASNFLTRWEKHPLFLIHWNWHTYIYVCVQFSSV